MLRSAYPTTESQIKLELQNTDLWSRFASLSTEMVLTKKGRRMFPLLRVAVRGLDPELLYDFKLDFVSCDHHRWRYVNGQWQTNIKQEPSTTNYDRRYGLTIKGEPYSHPKSPNYGRFWMSDIVEFTQVKLTNRQNTDNEDLIILNSLHKYEPRILILQSLSNGQPSILLNTFNFPLTSFITVTAYQNEEMTALKIRHNPFAKAFQEPRERIEYDETEVDYSTPQFPSIPSYMLPFTAGGDSATSSSQVHRHRSSAGVHRSRPYYHHSLMSSNSPPLVAVDQVPLFDYANASTTFQHYPISNWPSFQLPNHHNPHPI